MPLLVNVGRQPAVQWAGQMSETGAQSVARARQRDRSGLWGRLQSIARTSHGSYVQRQQRGAADEPVDTRRENGASSFRVGLTIFYDEPP